VMFFFFRGRSRRKNKRQREGSNRALLGAGVRGLTRMWEMSADTLNVTHRIWTSNDREWLRDNLVHPF